MPQEIYKYVANVTLRPLDPAPPSRNCITEAISADTRRVHYHHATPLLRVTMCKRGDCKPDVGNTVLFGIIQCVAIFLARATEGRLMTGRAASNTTRSRTSSTSEESSPGVGLFANYRPVPLLTCVYRHHLAV